VSGQRALPEQASLRYLKVEAKRRRAAGEFPTLHDAQLAIAREHGQPSWSALKAAVGAAAGREGHALAQLRWIVSRFRDAGQPGWAGPGDAELRAHFTDRFLAEFPPGRLVDMITAVAGELRAELTVLSDAPFTAQGRIAGHLVTAMTEPRPPYRLTGVRMRRLGELVSDPRTAAPATASLGAVPDGLPALAAAAAEQIGLVGLVLAGGTRGDGAWATASGWANLERAEPLTPGHLFPANAVTMAVTALAVLRLAADGRLRLDDPAGRYLGEVRLADDTVTIRELLTHTGGVANPPAPFRPAVPPLAEVTGTVLACSGRHGTFDLSLAGYAALGEVIADRAGQPYPDAATRLVLGPLGMRDSWFPASWPDDGRVVTGYDVAAEGAYTPVPGLVCPLAATGGLWTSAADLVRLGLGWSSLLPPSLAAQALRPHADQPNGARRGLCWIVNERAGLAGHAGDGPGMAASLLVTLDGRHACAALANRQTLVEPVAGQALALTAGRPGPGRSGGRSDGARTRSS
jgi:CubicO group peptidase (beta-lactamase class C family)